MMDINQVFQRLIKQQAEPRNCFHVLKSGAKNALFMIALPVVTACLLTLHNCFLFSYDCRNCATLDSGRDDLEAQSKSTTLEKYNLL